MRTLPIRSSMLLAAALGLAACQTDGPIAPAAEPFTGTWHAAVEPRPLSGSCTVTGVRFVSMVPPILSQTSTAVCRISLLGRVTIVNQQHIDVTTGVQVAEAVWTTASGDQLYATSLGTAVPTGATTIRFSGITTIAGGTGRFANAKGSAEVEGTADNAAGTGSFTFRGSLRFDGSDAVTP